MEFQVDDITVRIVDSNTKSTKEEDFNRLVDYFSVLQEIYNDNKTS